MMPVEIQDADVISAAILSFFFCQYVCKQTNAWKNIQGNNMTFNNKSLIQDTRGYCILKSIHQGLI